MAVCLLECREDEERRADFLVKRLEMMATFTDGAILAEI